MLGSNIAWGLDIGSATLKAVKLRRSGASVEVMDFDVIEIEHSDDESTRDMRNGAAIAEVARRKNFGSAPVVLSVPGNQVFFRPFNLPGVGDRKIPEIVNYEARQQVPFPLEEVVWDYRVAKGVGGAELAISLVAIRREIVEKLLSCVKQHKLNVVGIAPCPVAGMNFVAYDIQPRETCLLLDAGAKVTDFAIMHEGNFWFRPLPVAGDDLTRVFEQKFRMPFQEAENLKTKLAESKQYEKMFKVVEPTLRSLAGEIQRTSGYYLSLQRGVKISRVFGLGQTFRMPGLADFLTQNIDMDLELVGSPSRVMVSPSIDTVWFAEEFPSMGAAIGLALQGLGLATVSMQLLPEWVTAEQRARERRWYFAAAAAAILGLVVSYHADAYFDGKNLKGEEGLNQQMEDVLKEVEAKKKEVAEAGKKASPLTNQLERWSSIGVDRGVYEDISAKVFRVIEEHNRSLGAGRDGLPEGAILISDLRITRQGLAAEEGLSPDSSIKGSIGSRKDNLFYVLARFECRGAASGQLDAAAAGMLQFEKRLHEVAGFKALPRKSGAPDNWVVQGYGPKHLPHMAAEWLQGKPVGTPGDNTWVAWAVWLYDKNSAAGVESEAVAAVE